ncbi:TPA: IS200/IS605 family transposase, partial [Streptococcus suis]|nr:IS200/IS605 family transposase [Streptococcus suis]HEM5748204.1 IS200/IS605 family transposase [Streptococcus suis]HEM5775049.1 IS200/IS605 family transposase [Streptococcus suis]HEM5810470.1 IS200/IS605 family transposase [Streptococcus suis]HEM5816729.1 IS200/IS605 family transposase [Streptococcus suis]
LHELQLKKRVKHDIALDKLSVKEYEDPFRDNGK